MQTHEKSPLETPMQQYSQKANRREDMGTYLHQNRLPCLPFLSLRAFRGKRARHQAGARPQYTPSPAQNTLNKKSKRAEKLLKTAPKRFDKLANPIRTHTDADGRLGRKPDGRAV
ncbi:MAG: hypothetical protein IAB08_08190 [Bacteroidetes bacterium]|uniref:Uncharacterized protein n=1 Tax=Candidatus Pullibacteroides excrementavium TaxID=2840905 RepID=A0A9D9GZU9_9BACT|nr:hypothetical protein [Candidatus Pullibacteroides excrementavium]